jgi:hypothetical protein
LGVGAERKHEATEEEECFHGSFFSGAAVILRCGKLFKVRAKSLPVFIFFAARMGAIVALSG